MPALWETLRGGKVTLRRSAASTDRLHVGSVAIKPKACCYFLSV
jgi:hypothetical protein